MDTSVDTVMDILKKSHYSDYIGEGLTQLEHVVLSALEAQAKSEPLEIVIGALLHDIGHQLKIQDMVDSTGFVLGVANHEHIGADYLKKLGYNDKVCELVRNHVAAKRYLCYKDPTYVQNLSEASRKTLELQNSVMNETEATEFEAKPYFESMIKVRHYDDLGKDIKKLNDKDIFVELEKFRPLVRQCCEPKKFN